MKTIGKLILLVALFSCGNNLKSGEKFYNTGVTTVLNGKNMNDSLRYRCDSCVEILKDKLVFDTIISIATAEAKERLKNKLSFAPLSVNISVIPQDSSYYVHGKHIDSLVIVLAEYKCIGKNGYGVEDEVESTSIIYLVNNKVVDLDGKIRKDSLFIRSSGAVNRNLNLYGNAGTIVIQPMNLDGNTHLIVTTEESCVENTKLRIGFDDKQEISVSSWNDFNCESTSYFRLNAAELALLKARPIQYVTFSGDEFIFCAVPENETDYFRQYVGLLKR